ncbi:hypothetical protein [Sphingomonas sp. PP-CE-1G-424]|nr:hypothetical protein [Sphingomonas sp. PP-CE-1G-424]TCP65624.1 hypothetical protein C8J43_11061 [Sphingomonas sp. PP-CE-1G-424]
MSTTRSLRDLLTIGAAALEHRNRIWAVRYGRRDRLVASTE